jgi:hypothetical protein
MNKFVINCTPHDINIVDGDLNRIVMIPKQPADPVARVATTKQAIHELDVAGAVIPVFRTVVLDGRGGPTIRGRDESGYFFTGPYKVQQGTTVLRVGTNQLTVTYGGVP